MPRAFASRAFRKLNIRPPIQRPKSVSIAVPQGYPDDAIIAFPFPTLGSGVFSMTPMTGADVDTATGDIFLTSASAFFAAVLANGGTLTTVLHSSNPAVADVTLTFSKGADHADLSPFAANATMWFDAADNREFTVDSAGAVISFADKGGLAGGRVARNDFYASGRPTRPGDSYVANSHPALRFAPTSSSGVSFLEFCAKPIFAGLQRLAFNGNALNLATRWDAAYSNNGKTTVTPASPGFAFTPAASGRPTLVAIIAKTDGTVKYRVNGVQVATGTIASPWPLPTYDTVFFALFYTVDVVLAAGQVFCQNGIGNGYVFKGSPFKGDIHELITLVKATEA